MQYYCSSILRLLDRHVCIVFAFIFDIDCHSRWTAFNHFDELDSSKVGKSSLTKYGAGQPGIHMYIVSKWRLTLMSASVQSDAMFLTRIAATGSSGTGVKKGLRRSTGRL